MRQPDHNVATCQVWLWRDRWNRPQAHCDCGWTGRARIFRGTASTDALLHTVHTDHHPADPIDKWKATGGSSIIEDLHAAFWMVCFIAIMAFALGYSVVPS